MIQVLILTSHDLNGHTFSYPIRAFASYLRELGITVRFQYKLDVKTIAHYDVFGIVDNTYNRKWFPDKSTLRTLLGQIRSQVPGLIWFDTKDSTGNFRTTVFPLVDIYAKSQLLKDLNIYNQSGLYSWIYYSHYYHNRFNIDDLNKSDFQGNDPILPEYLAKLRVSWNIGLGDWNVLRGGKWQRRIRYFRSRAHYHCRVIPPISPRDIHIFFRASIPDKVSTLTFQRHETLRRLTMLSNTEKYKIVYHGKVPYRQYLDEIRRSQVTVSPFGWGEVCYRDFESLLNGAVLFKPDMSLIDTWPDYYRPNETYIPYSWDFSDFETRLVELVNSPALRLQIAEAGQANLLTTFSAEGGQVFAQRFADIIQAALNN